MLSWVGGGYSDVRLDDNGEYDAVDGDRLAEENRDQVFGANAWRTHAATNDARARQVDPPVEIQVMQGALAL